MRSFSNKLAFNPKNVKIQSFNMVTLSGVDSSGLEGKTSIVKPFSSSTCSLLSKYIPNLRSKMFFRCLINLVVISMLGPVTIHI